MIHRSANELIDPTERRTSAATKPIVRWRVPILACLTAVLLHGALLLTLADVGSLVGMQSYLADFGGIGRAQSASFLDYDDPANKQEDDETVKRLGIVNIRPDEKVGTWVISDTAYAVSESTDVQEGVSVGQCVEVEAAAGTPTIALKIQKKEASDCVDEDDNDPGNDEEDDRHKWEGPIVSFPTSLIGTWAISIDEGTRLTFTTNLATRFDPESPTAFAVGRWVEVKGSRQQDGSFLAERVRVDDYEVGEIVVRLESAAYSSTIASKYHLVLTSTLLSTANIYLFTTTEDDEQRLVQKIAQEEGVIWAEVNFVNGVPEDDGYKTWGWGGISEPDEYANQSAYQQIRWGQASHFYQGDGVVVAVLDTGIYTQHEQFEGKLQLPSLDVIDDDLDPSEVGPGLAWGHGTHVAGVIAAMSPAVEILPVRVLDENGRGNTFLLAYAIEWVAQQPGVKVINLSLGTQFDSEILRDVIESTVEQGILVVAAAGNSATDQVQYPAGYHDVIGVTAVDSNSHKADFANYGEEWVDIAAPGVGIMSTMVNVEGAGYATWSGTSMSTAFVSGAAALMVEKWDGQVATFGEMADQLVNSGVVVDALNPLFVGQIGRLLDVSAALDVQPTLIFMPQMQK